MLSLSGSVSLRKQGEFDGSNIFRDCKNIREDHGRKTQTCMKIVYRTVAYFIVACFGLCNIVEAQSQSLDVDSAFAAARTLAFNGKRKEGRELALRLIQQHPAYLDLKTFVGRTYAWDGAYAEARAQFAAVTTTDANTLDNYLAWADAERWADEPSKEMNVVEKGLARFSDNADLLYRKAKLLSNTGRMAEAKSFAQKALRKQPNHEAAYVLLQELRSQLLDNSISAGFSYDQYSKYYSSSKLAYVQASRATRLGSLIARVNYASRFGKAAFQPEVDLYPRLFRGFYAYLNAGFSGENLFPKHRYGAEVFASLPHSFEASVGARYLNFGPDSKVTIYTGSIGYYVGNYWLSFRPYITPDSGRSGTSASLTVRRYFRNPEQYFSVRTGAGISPELLNTQIAPNVTAKQFYNLRSHSISIGYQQPLSKRWTVNGSIGVSQQEPPFAAGEYVTNTSGSLSLRYRYK